MAQCSDVRAMLDMLSDGELPAARTLELTSHAEGCEPCGELLSFERAMRRSLQNAVERDASVSDDLERRIREAIESEARAEKNAMRLTSTPPMAARHARLVGAIALAAAAALVLFVGSDFRPWSDDATVVAPPVAAVATHGPLGSEELLDRLIDYHSAPPAPEVTEPSLIPELERDVGVRVPIPSLVQYGARWQGGSVARVRPDQRAAYLRYRTADDHTVTVYVYNASRLPVHAGLRPRLYREEPVYVGNRRGYAIAARLRDGVGYAVATDLGDDQSEELVHVVSQGSVSKLDGKAGRRSGVLRDDRWKPIRSTLH